MTGYDYVRSIDELYRPRTPQAALKAVEAGILPAEAFVYKSAQAKPLFEEPYDIEELERVLAKPDLPLSTGLLLMDVFVKMTKLADKELALFAAESINALEGRYVGRINALRARIKKNEASCGLSTSLARELYEYSLLNGRYPIIKNYYLREAYYAITNDREGCEDFEGFTLMVRCLLRLGLMPQAEKAVAERMERDGEPRVVLLAIEAAFQRKDAVRVAELLRSPEAKVLAVDEAYRRFFEAWRGEKA